MKMKQKSVIFLGNGFVLTDEEAKLIELCSKNEILVLTYSRIDDKKVDVERIRKSTGLSTEYKQVKQFEPLTEFFYEQNKTSDLHFDVTFASPYHIMELTPFGYLSNNKVTVMGDEELIFMEHLYLDYGNLDDYEQETVDYIKDTEEGRTVKEISDDLTEMDRKKNSGGYARIPDHRKTINRNLKSLYERGYVDKNGRPAKYYLNKNQQFMYKLTTMRRE